MSDEIRIIKSKALTAAEKDLLDGAPILDPDSLDRAIIGVVETPAGHAAVYSYEKLVRAMKRDSPGSSRDDVVEWIGYNTIRALPYMGQRAPWILEEFLEPEFSGDDEDERPVNWNGKLWWRHK